MNNGLVSIPPKTVIITPRLSGTAVGGFQPFQVPDCSIVNFFLVGGGGGGGAGFSSTAGTNRGGGGGGSAGGVTRASVPRILLPDVLYVRAGTGGDGAIAGGASAGKGLRSIIMFIPGAASISVNSQFLCSSAHSSDAGGGFSATSSAGGASGTGASAFSEANGDWSEIAMFLSTTGGNGGGGGNSASAGTALTTAGIVVGGGGGAGTDTANTTRVGGTVSFTMGYAYSSPGGVNAGESGSNGFWSLSPFFSLGGGGGASNGTGTGGSGGAGGVGSGGGGGGAGVTGGNGGRGGDGICIITWS